MKAFFCLAALVASAQAGVVLSTGASTQHRSEDGLGNYAFGYDEGHATGGSFRKETGNAFGVKVGSYGLRDADGRVRTVNYVADAAGFRASVSTNEPGTAPSLPAAAAYNAPVAKVAVAAAPVVAAASYAAPVAVAAPAYAAHTYAAPAYSAPVAVAAPAYAAPVAVAAPAAYSYGHHVAAAPALSYAAPVAVAKAVHAYAAPGVPAQYAANVFAPSGSPFVY